MKGNSPFNILEEFHISRTYLLGFTVLQRILKTATKKCNSVLVAFISNPAHAEILPVQSLP
jgi:hypothetical protein